MDDSFQEIFGKSFKEVVRGDTNQGVRCKKTGKYDDLKESTDDSPMIMPNTAYPRPGAGKWFPKDSIHGYPNPILPGDQPTNKNGKMRDTPAPQSNSGYFYQ